MRVCVCVCGCACCQSQISWNELSKAGKKTANRNAAGAEGIHPSLGPIAVATREKEGWGEGSARGQPCALVLRQVIYIFDMQNISYTSFQGRGQDRRICIQKEPDEERERARAGELKEGDVAGFVQKSGICKRSDIAFAVAIAIAK